MVRAVAGGIAHLITHRGVSCLATGIMVTTAVAVASYASSFFLAVCLAGGVGVILAAAYGRAWYYHRPAPILLPPPQSPTFTPHALSARLSRPGSPVDIPVTLPPPQVLQRRERSVQVEVPRFARAGISAFVRTQLDKAPQEAREVAEPGRGLRQDSWYWQAMTAQLTSFIAQYLLPNHRVDMQKNSYTVVVEREGPMLRRHVTFNIFEGNTPAPSPCGTVKVILTIPQHGAPATISTILACPASCLYPLSS